MKKNIRKFKFFRKHIKILSLIIIIFAVFAKCKYEEYTFAHYGIILKATIIDRYTKSSKGIHYPRICYSYEYKGKMYKQWCSAETEVRQDVQIGDTIDIILDPMYFNESIPMYEYNNGGMSRFC